jgi:exonuclease III
LLWKGSVVFVTIFEIIKPDVILVQEPYVNKNLKLSLVPPNYRCFYNLFFPPKKICSAAIFVKNTLKADLHYDVSTNKCVVVSIYINMKTFTVVSAYFPPSYKNPSLCLSPIDTLGNRCTLILGGDFNSRSPLL